jgi:glycosyltransferase involved in cell wall biosynthesis
LVRQLQYYYPQHEYHLFTPQTSNHDYVQDFLNGNFKIHTMPKWSNSSIWRTIGMSQTINELGLDIYHGLSHEIPYFIGAQTKKVVTIHDLIYEIKPQLFPMIDGFFYRKKYRSSCIRADHIIAISQQTKQDISSIYRLQDKTTCIYQSCAEIFQTKPINHTPTKKHFLYVGTINRRKGLLNIVEAYAKLPNAHQLPFVIIGEGGDYKSQVIEKINALHLTEKFLFVGNVDNDSLIKFYDDALCLVLPSLYEGFGRPVITSNISSLPEACGPGGLLVDPENIDALAESMSKMFESQTWQTCSDKGHVYAQENFSTAICYHKIMDFYKSIIK